MLSELINNKLNGWNHISYTKILTELDVGDVFDDNNNTIFEVKKKLGKGGFGIAYLVENMSDKKNYVAKIPLIIKDKDDDYRIRKQIHEAEILTLLKDNNIPNVVSIVKNIENTKVNGIQVPILLMELARGKTCGEIQKESEFECFQENIVKTILIKIAEALIEIHKLGIIHRDIKPENIFVDNLDQDPVITLIDFGIAALFDQSKTLNKVTVVGTPFYSPPEQSQNGIVSYSADVFGLASTGFHLVTGKILHGQTGKYNPRIHAKKNNPISQEFANVIIKATWPDLKERFPLMNDFLCALQGKPSVSQSPRIISDGREYRIEKDYILIGRANSNIIPPPDIEVQERSKTGEFFLSRKHCYIQKGSDNYHRLFDHKSVNGTVWLNKNNEWRSIPSSGLPLANRPIIIGLGFSNESTGKIDMFGNEILPGAYKVIEYRPAESNTPSRKN